LQTKLKGKVPFDRNSLAKSVRFERKNEKEITREKLIKEHNNL